MIGGSILAREPIAPCISKLAPILLHYKKLLLHPGKVMAIVPPHLLAKEYDPRPQRRPARLRGWLRICLVLIALGLLAVFAVAIYLNPYKDGKVWFEETHRQLGLAPCTFKDMTGLPCPSCGMTSSFALLVRGDLWHSVQANFVGTLLALFCLAVIPWCLISACRGKLAWVRSFEYVFVRLVVGFLALLLLRWAIVLLLIFLGGNGR